MLKYLAVALSSYLILGWVSLQATGTLVVDGHPINLPSTPSGRVLVKSGLADFKGLSFFALSGEFLRHSNYQLISSSELPSITSPDIQTLYDATFLLVPVYDGANVITHNLRAINLPFYSLAAGTPPYVTRDAAKFARIAINFDSPLGWYCMLAGRYRALIAALCLLLGLALNFSRIGAKGQAIIAAAACFYTTTWWWAFSPGLFTGDSIYQLQTALSQQFDTTHPPFMALVAAAVIQLGGKIEYIISAQCALGVAGVFGLAWQLTNGTGNKKFLAAILVTSLIISPVFPFMPYFLTFWKDAWAGIAMLWAAIAVLANSNSRAQKVVTATILFLSAVIFTAVRHNSIVLAPIFALTIAMHFRDNFRTTTWANTVIGILSLAALLACQPTINYFGHAKDNNASNQIYLLELLGAQLESPTISAKTPLITANIIDPQWQAHFDLSRNDQLFGWGAPAIVSDKLGKFYDPIPGLSEEYLSAWLAEPLTMLKVKLKTFYILLSNPRSPYANGITSNELGLHFAPTGEMVRNTLFWLTERTWNTSIRVIITPIFCLAFVMVYLSFTIYKQGVRSPHKMNCVLALTCGLYFIYLLACPSAEYRYMFPAIALTTIIAISAGFNWGLKFNKRGKTT